MALFFSGLFKAQNIFLTELLLLDKLHQMLIHEASMSALRKEEEATKPTVEIEDRNQAHSEGFSLKDQAHSEV